MSAVTSPVPDQALPLSGRSALITGAASGIGRATALAFAAAGAALMLADVDLAGAEATVELVRAGGGTAVFQRTDVTSAVFGGGGLFGLVAVAGRANGPEAGAHLVRGVQHACRAFRPSLGRGDGGAL